MRFVVESWSAEYGAPFEPQPDSATPPRVDASVELQPAAWRALPPRGAAARSVLFIDGVRRIDARVWTDEGDGVGRMGICASYAAGVVRCGATAAIENVKVEHGVFGPSGLGPIACGVVNYVSHAVADQTLDALINAVQQRLGSLEVAVAATAGGADLIAVDGPLSGRENVPGAVGVIKSHQVQYLEPALTAVVGKLAAGERTPIFLTQTTWSRYSWYLRLPGGSGHPWAGIVRCEAAESLSVAEVIAQADLSAATLPRFASEAHKDPRAPQNLYPVGGLERALRRRLGDPTVLHRSLLVAAARAL